MRLRDFACSAAMQLDRIVADDHHWSGLQVYKVEDIEGWNTDDVVCDLVREIGACEVIELGSWQGASAIPIARAILQIPTPPRTHRYPPAVLCVDTWLGSSEHINGGHGAYADIRPDGSRLPLLTKFLRNVARGDLADIVFPFPATTSTAAEILRRYHVTADLIYVDAAHAYEDVIRDLRDYWPIVRDGGVLVGDDYDVMFPGVVRAVAEFAGNVDIVPELQGRKYIFRKRVGTGVTE